MYMIWQVIVGNGQQRPVATAAAFLVLYVEAVTVTAAVTQVVVATNLRPTATAPLHSAQSYTCRA